MTLNLPVDRDVTLGPNDAWPSPVGNNVQDAIKFHWRKPWTRQVFPVPMRIVGPGTWAVVDNPALVTFLPPWQSAGGATEMLFSLPSEQGDRLTKVAWEMYGDGAVDLLDVEVVYWTDTHSIKNIIWNSSGAVLNIPAAWTPFDTTTGVPFSPPAGGLPASGLYTVKLHVSAANFCFGIVTATYDRLP